jgi:hypothetical protein
MIDAAATDGAKRDAAADRAFRAAPPLREDKRPFRDISQAILQLRREEISTPLDLIRFAES